MKTDKKIKVLQIINSLNIGGAEKLVVDIASELRDSPVLCDVLSLKKSDSFLSEKLKNFKGVRFDYLTEGSVYNPFLIFKIIKYARKYDIVHLHLFPTLYWATLACVFLPGLKIVYTEHNTENRRRASLILRFVDRLMYRRLDKVTCITEGTKANLVKHLKYDNDFQVINNGIIVKHYERKTNFNDYNFFQSNFRIIQVSSFREQKDQITLLKALMLLPEEISLILVGEGHLKQSCIDFVSANGLGERVEFLGIRKDVPELLNYAHVVVLSSHYEGFGLSILEGMATGKPAIASNVAGIREIVDGYGIMFQRGDSEALARSILSLKQSRENYIKVATRCARRAHDFDISRMKERFINVYNKVL